MKKSYKSIYFGLAALCFAFCMSTAFASPLNEKLIAGYLDITATGSASKVDMSQAKADGYNIVIFAFAKVDGTEVSFRSPSDENIAQKQMSDAKKIGMKTLISFGGQFNTFNPGNLSKNQIDQLAQNLIRFAKTYGFNGIDFDLEIKTDPLLLTQLTQSIKTHAHDLIITAAPQINGGKLVTTGNNNDYDQAIANNGFDYLFLQEYNTPPENEISFIANSFQSLSQSIPANTQLVIGEPTAAVAAGTMTIYYPDTKTTLSTEQATAAMLPELAKIKNASSFGGVMGWSLNVDYDAADYGDYTHVSGTYAYGLKNCVINNDCTTPPPPKPRTSNYNLQISNLGKQLGDTVKITDSSGKTFTSDYLAPNSNKVYNNQTNPSAAIIEGQKGLIVTWSTYQGGPTGSCPLRFDLTHNTHVMINPDTKACEIKELPQSH